MAAIKLSTLQECDQALSTAAANLKYYNFMVLVSNWVGIPLSPFNGT